VRTLLGVTFIAICLMPAGCNTSRNSRSADKNSTASTTPFMGSPSSEPAVSPAPSKNPAGLASTGSPPVGWLAGRVVDETGRLKPGALIEVIDLDTPPRGEAPLKVLANKDGFFDVQGLEGGHHYRLVASVKDGVRILIGSARAKAPDIRVLLVLNAEQAAPANSGISKASPAMEGGIPPIPPVSIGTPTPTTAVNGIQTPLPAGGGGQGALREPQPGGEVKPPPTPVGEDHLRSEGSAPRLAPPAGANPELIANGTDGFARVPSANINGPGRGDAPSHKPQTPPYAPPTPPETYGSGQGSPSVLPISTAPSATPPAAPVPAVPAAAPPSATAAAAVPPPIPAMVVSAPPAPRVPFCNKVGDRVDNFGLTDFDGKVWELKAQRTGKVVLLDFWFSDCPPCRGAIPHLVELQKKYATFGLQVVSIAYERGSLAEKQKAVQPLRARYAITYPILFGGVGIGGCPLRKDLEINAFPTLVLLDDSGRILFRTKDGLSKQAAYDLEMEIRRQLRLPLR
jgi:thiol-disulfide isomerase/thioredoxin